MIAVAAAELSTVWVKVGLAVQVGQGVPTLGGRHREREAGDGRGDEEGLGQGPDGLGLDRAGSPGDGERPASPRW